MFQSLHGTTFAIDFSFIVDNTRTHGIYSPNPTNVNWGYLLIIFLYKDKYLYWVTVDYIK